MLVVHKHIKAIAEQEQFGIVIIQAVDIKLQVKYIELVMSKSIQVADTITNKLVPVEQLTILLEQVVVLVLRQVGSVGCIEFILAGKLIKQSDMMAG
jgi:hypothetical protein